MKRSAFILALLCLFSFSSLFAQHNSFYIGANGGVNLSKFKFTEDLSELYPTSDAIFGLNGGISLGFEVKGFTLSTGLQYVQKGSDYQTDNFVEDGTTGFFSARERLHYLSIPILVGYRHHMGGRAGLSIAMGPSINIGLGGKIDEYTEYFGSDEVDTENYVVSYGTSVNDDYKSTQAGFQISPGLFFVINDRSKLTFNVTWDIGLSDSYNPRYKNANDFFNTTKGNQMNRSTMFSLGYEHHFVIGDRY
jgi:hypothetical protein